MLDFVCNKGSKRYYIQSAYAIPDQAKMEQEQRSLVMTGDFFKKIIITKDVPASYYNDDGVLIMSIYDFLLNADSLEMQNRQKWLMIEVQDKETMEDVFRLINLRKRASA